MIDKILVDEDVDLAPLTTLKVGGKARYFVKAETEAGVAQAVEFANRSELKLFVLGGGSNVLISDNGFDGLVLQIGIKGIGSVDSQKHHKTELEPHDPTLITAGAGEEWDSFVSYCVENDLAGVECLSGIPGLVGGTPVQNVGAYGQEVSESIVSVRCFDRQTCEFVELANSECGFAYRTSIFNSVQRERFIVLSVVFSLMSRGCPSVTYKDLIQYFGGKEPSLREVRDAVLRIRRSKSMVIDPADPNSRSAGSFFKNPIVDQTKLDRIRRSFDDIPHFDFGDKCKIPAAWLIEHSGFRKGFALGNAGISANHTLAIINRGQAVASEIIALENLIQRKVADKFGIELDPEPVFVGF